MCDSATMTALETIIQGKINNGEIFTAFDITKELRVQVGKSVRISHNDVKHDIHDLIQRHSNSGSVSYSRTLVDLPGVPERPFLYHPQGSDINTYGPLAQSNAAATAGHSVVVVSDPNDPALPSATPSATATLNTTAAASNSAPAFPSATPSNDPDVIQQDNRGRLWIQARFLNGLGVSHPQPVYVTQSTVKSNGTDVPVLKITTATPAGATEAVEYIVDRHANIAISKGVLLDAGLDGQGNYKVEGTATDVTVRVA